MTFNLDSTSQRPVYDMLRKEPYRSNRSVEAMRVLRKICLSLLLCIWGLPLAVMADDRVVVNEFMYNPLSSDADEEFVELYNYGETEADLSGWRFVDGIDYTFPAGTTLEPGGYLVVAQTPDRFQSDTDLIHIQYQQGAGGYSGAHDTYMQTSDPGRGRGSEAEWEWDGEDGGGRNYGFLRFDDIIGSAPSQIPPGADIVGAVLTLVVTNEGNAAETATVHELLVPFDDTRGLSGFGNGAGPRAGTDYNESVVASIPGPSLGQTLEVNVTESIRSLAAGSANHGWVFIPDPGGTNGIGIASSEAGGDRPLLTVTIRDENPSTQVLSVLGPFEGRLNDAGERVRLRNAAGEVVEEFTYMDEHGWPQTADGEGSSVERRHPRMPAGYYQSWHVGPPGGTPGRANSSAIDLPEPVVLGVLHNPLIPTAAQPVGVTCGVDSADTIQSVVLHHRVDGASTFSEIQMERGPDEMYSAMIPAAGDGTIIEFFVRASSTSGVGGTFPLDAPERTGIYQVDSPAFPDDLPLYRIVMRSELRRQLYRRSAQSNVQLDACFYAGGQVYYNVGVRFRGKGSRGQEPKSFRVDFTNTQPFGTIRKLNLNGWNPHRQMLGLEFFRQAEIVAPTHQLVSLVFNDVYVREYIQVERTDKDMMRRAFTDASGNLYRGVEQANLDYRGEDGARYRSNYEKITNEREDDYSDLIALCQTFSSADDATFAEVIQERINVDQWLRWFAAKAVLVDEEGGISLERGDDYYMYHYPVDDRFYMLPWDLDSVLIRSSRSIFIPQVPAIRRLLTHPAFAPRYYTQVASLMADEFQDAPMAEIVAMTEPITSAGFRSQVMDIVRVRRADLEAQIPTALTVTHEQTGEPVVIAGPGETWRFFRGRSEPSGGTTDWASPEFDDSTWETGPAGIGYGDGDDATTLNDMRNNYLSVYMRRTFEITDIAEVSLLALSIDYDDSFVAYLNGHEVARRNVSGIPPAFNETSDGNHEAGTPELFDLRDDMRHLLPGTNVLAVQGHNTGLTSSDFSLIPALVGSVGTTVNLLSGTAPAAWTSFVTVDGESAAYDTLTARWQYTLQLGPGWNDVLVEARDYDGQVVAQETVRILNSDPSGGISGTLTENTRWTPEESPYTLTGDLIVPSGITLTVEAGTEITLAAGVGIQVYGQFLVEGTFAAPVTMHALVQGTSWNGILFENATDESVLRYCLFRDGTVASRDGQGLGAFISVREAHLTVEGCVLRHLPAAGIDAHDSTIVVRDSVFEDLEEGIHSTGCSELVERCAFSGMRGHHDAIDFNGSRGNPSIIRHVVIAGGDDDGIDLGGGDVTIDSCRVSGMADKAISVEGDGVTIVLNCVLIDNDIGVAVKDRSQTFITNCTLFSNTSFGVRVYENVAGQGGGHARLVNSVLWRDGVEIDVDSLSTAEVSHCLVRGGYDGTEILDTDPLFVDADTGDFRLAESSPALNRGAFVDAPAVDIEERQRPQGAGIDLGAYEREVISPVSEWVRFGR